MKKPLKYPQFQNADEEFEFFSNLDLDDHFHPSDFRHAEFPKLKPTTQSISLRIPLTLLNRIKSEANRRDVPYQSFIKMKLSEMFGVA
jgi:predicted DNA binding CopG/RHH family protein